MPNPVEGLLEVYEDMVEVLLVRGYFSQRILRLKNLRCDAPSCSEACLLFSDDLLRLRFQYMFSMIFSVTLLGWLMRLIIR